MKSPKATRRPGPVENDTLPVGRRATGRVTKQQWLTEALKMFASEGVESVRITSLARRLKISKSGFYWHFEDRNDLLQEMKRFWVDEFTQEIISEVLMSEGPLKQRLQYLVRTIRERQSGQYDLAFALWAKRDPEIRDLVDSVWDMRLAFARELLADAGFEGVEIEPRARLLLVYFAWSEVMFDPTAGKLKDEPLDEIVNILAGPPTNSKITCPRT